MGDIDIAGKMISWAEDAGWTELSEVLNKGDKYANALTIQDEFGMTCLHWACTDPAVHLSVLKKITRTCPISCQQKNDSGMLPMHIAVDNKLPKSHLEVLFSAYPLAMQSEDHMSRLPTDIAERAGYLDRDVAMVHDIAERSAKAVGRSSSTPTDTSSMSGRSSCAMSDSEDYVTLNWHPKQKLGVSLVQDSKDHDSGARVSRVRNSSIAGVERLSSGDLLYAIDGCPVVDQSFKKTVKNMKHARKAIQLTFVKAHGKENSFGHRSMNAATLA